MTDLAAQIGSSPRARRAFAEFVDAEALLTGHFVLSSGLRSPHYLQCARVLEDPRRAARLAAMLLEDLEAAGRGPAAWEMVIAPAMGGLIIGYELARQAERPFAFTERVDGAFALRRGFRIEPGRRYLLVEDVVTTGESSRECAECAAAHGGALAAAACLVDRSGGSAEIGAPLTALLRLDIPTYEAGDLPPELAAIPAIKPGSRGLSRAPAPM